MPSLSRGAADGARDKLHDEMLRRERSERHDAETRLKLLQAQIEPHFLFNTLSNVLSLMDRDDPNARRMLENLTAFLRASLQRTRDGSGSVNDEFEVLRSYLEIQQLRFGDRLRFVLSADDDVAQHALPPLLVQPLVENAVLHGIAPREAGGTVEVTAARGASDRLQVTVKDDGVGLDESGRSGTGLTNVRERVSALYGDRGRLTLAPRDPRGLVATLDLPSQ